VHEGRRSLLLRHANFNGVMGKNSRARVGFDACMFMLHKTFGARRAGAPPPAPTAV